jgi:nucleoid-associated protein YgaU
MAVSGFRQGTGNIAVMIDDISAQLSLSPEGYLAEAIIPDADQFPVAVAMTDYNGETLASARIILNKSKLHETLSGNALVVVQKGDALWRIAYRTYGEGIRYVDIYSSNAGEIKNPDLIYPDQIFIIPNQ